MHLRGDPPPKLPSTSYFNRFEPRILEERRSACLSLLQHAGSNHILYSSQVFVGFLASPSISAEPSTLSPSLNSEEEEEEEEDEEVNEKFAGK